MLVSFTYAQTSVSMSFFARHVPALWTNARGAVPYTVGGAVEHETPGDYDARCVQF